MKLVEIKCKNCGNPLKLEEGIKQITCIYCKTTFVIDDEVVHIQHDNMDVSGYEFEKGRIRAQEEEKIRKQREKEEKEQKIIEAQMKKEAESYRKAKMFKWWFLGWLFFFPIPTTVLIWKSKMKKNFKIAFTVIVWLILIVLCIGVNINNNRPEDAAIIEANSDRIYEDAESFEKALNSDVRVANSTVIFNVKEYHPDSSLGIDCWAGEHLNFISKTELDVKSGDKITAKILKQPNKVLGSWKIEYDVISIEKIDE